jgi:hypothetical protein
VAIREEEKRVMHAPTAGRESDASLVKTSQLRRESGAEWTER